MLSGFAAVLVGLVAVELVFALQRPNFFPPARSASQVSAKTGDVVYPPPAEISAWSAEVLARPLFVTSRRAPVAAAAARVGISRLTGIIVTPSETVAIFSPAMGGPITVEKNSRFGAFAVLSIVADSVTVKGPDGVIVMHPDTGDQVQGKGETPTPAMTVLPGGIDVYLIKIPLGSVKPSWPFGAHPF